MAQEFMPIQGIGVAGIVSDIPDEELPPNVITDARNIRCKSAGVAFTGGREVLSIPRTSFDAGWLIHNHMTDSGNPTWLVAGGSAIYLYKNLSTGGPELPGADWEDISPAEQQDDLDPLLYSGDNLGKMSIINHPDNGAYYFDNILGTQMQYLPFSLDLSWPDAGKSCKVMRAYKNFLFALNLTEDGEHHPDGYRWSHPADANGYPYTWDENDLSGLASRESLGGGDGEIVDGLTLRDSFVIYSEHGIDVLDYTGSDLLFTRRALDTTAGLLASNCVVEVQGTHYFITDGDVMSNDGTNVASIMEDKVRRSFISDTNQDAYKNSYAVVNPLFNEVWFCIPSGTRSYPDIAYIFNYNTRAWSKRDLPSNQVFMSSGGVSLPKLKWNTVVGTWRNAVGTWASRVITPQSETLVGCVFTDSSLLINEPTGALGADVEAFIERIGIALAGVRQVTTINAVYPHITGDADLQLQMGYQNFPDEPVTWGPVHTFNPRYDRKVDVRSTGALHSYRLSSNGKQNWYCSGLDIEFVQRGLR